MTDITILTDSRYIDPKNINPYIENVLLEDNLLKQGLEKHGFLVERTNWDNPNYDWSKTKFALFRTTWDYFDRFQEFTMWLNKASKLTQFINPLDTILWNLDKRYLLEFERAGINIPKTYFIEKGDQRSLDEIIELTNWESTILKPVISGAGRHTYKLEGNKTSDVDSIFNELISSESMMIQEYQEQITTKGEIALMLFDGKFSHSILKKAKKGDFRVQDDFGGSVHDYLPTPDEIHFAERVMKSCPKLAVYARVDILWDNNNNLCLGELELIEPEMWFRNNLQSIDSFVFAIQKHLASFS